MRLFVSFRRNNLQRFLLFTTPILPFRRAFGHVGRYHEITASIWAALVFTMHCIALGWAGLGWLLWDGQQHASALWVLCSMVHRLARPIGMNIMLT